MIWKDSKWVLVCLILKLSEVIWSHLESFDIIWSHFVSWGNKISKNATLLKSSLSFLASQYYRRGRLRVVKICSSGGFDQSYTLIRTVVKTSKHLFIHRFWSVICLLVKVKTSKHLFIWMFWLVIYFEQIILSVSVENICSSGGFDQSYALSRSSY